MQVKQKLTTLCIQNHYQSMAGGVGPSTMCDKTGLFARFLNSTSNGNMAMHHGVNVGSIQGACSSSGLLEGASNVAESDWDPYENTSIYYPFVYNHKKVSNKQF